MESEDSDLDAYTMLKREIEESLRHILESEAADPSSCDLHFTLNSPKNNGKVIAMRGYFWIVILYFWLITYKPLLLLYAF